MTYHSLKFNRPVKLENGQTHIRWSDYFSQTPQDKLTFRMAVGTLKTNVESVMTGRRLAESPYADDRGKAKDFAEMLMGTYGNYPNCLPQLIGLCTPINFKIHGPNFSPPTNGMLVFEADPGLVRIQYAIPPLITPGGILSMPTYPSEEFGVDVVPVKTPFELQLLMAGLLRQMGKNAHLAFLDTLKPHPDHGEDNIREDTGAIVIFETNGTSDLHITSPNLQDLGSNWIAGLRAIDDVGLLAILRLNRADDAARIVNYHTKAVIMEILDAIGRGDVVGLIAGRAPVYTPMGQMPLEPEWLLDPGIGPRLIPGSYEALCMQFENWAMNMEHTLGKTLDAVAEFIGEAVRLEPLTDVSKRMIRETFNFLAHPQLVKVEEKLENAGTRL